MSLLADTGSAFVLGLLTPLTAACVLPLYPGFLTYLADQQPEGRHTYRLFGVLVVAGVLTFMLLLGLVFTTLLQASLTSVIGVVSPIAFGILALIAVALIVRPDMSWSGHVRTPETENSLVNAFGFGFFFGAIVIPCNPAFIAVFFTRAILFTDPVTSMVNFGAFGLGMGAPLLLFAVASARWSQEVIGTVTRYRTVINRVTGVVLLMVALYYLFVVFNVAGIR